MTTYELRKNGTRIIQKTFTEPSKTKSEFAPQTEINGIVDRYLKTGQLPESTRTGNYIDTTVIPKDLIDSMELSKTAIQSFQQLPAKIRRFFNDEPETFLDWMSDPSNDTQAQEMGLKPSMNSAGNHEEKITPQPTPKTKTPSSNQNDDSNDDKKKS